ncbi:MAG: hypothetical protein KUA43_05440 [Hoeflea sp.]|uniref:glycosyltransferase family 32 protein n=1 Tax=Hoeflea sp. TaxID=1940281 RepID=UPI001D632CB7|nr:glycosyltransferase [Hoeflea sp.]MBU4530975.1 hypothetical protein [Alphaproteobacteria bacterium]MBU4542750.1 hypothetical protein [Alphaproteobacteria bacterium]MBU4552562.1 hypothetical protein [Alphaproteobacteria bacterium]MBV1722867.1 hypothetical protein [Hoeflea sp.]MBV1762778.1 hypothetical protein [Hoeflea sp.]
MTTPRLLSQTWKSDALPPRADAFRRGWLTHNPDLQYRLFDNAASRTVVADVAPEHLDAYDAMPFPVMRADVFRYAVIFRDGGMYADIDMECLRPLPKALFDLSGLLSIEAKLDPARARELGYPMPFQIANCILAARPGHAFFKAALERCFRLFSEASTCDRSDVEDITGPRMLTRLFVQGGWPGLSVAEQILLMAPLHYPDLWPLNRNMVARHHHHGTWKDMAGGVSLSRKWIERNRTINPFPAQLWQEADLFLARGRRLLPGSMP